MWAYYEKDFVSKTEGLRKSKVSAGKDIELKQCWERNGLGRPHD